MSPTLKATPQWQQVEVACRLGGLLREMTAQLHLHNQAQAAAPWGSH